jgi:hypothetical protein
MAEVATNGQLTLINDARGKLCLIDSMISPTEKRWLTRPSIGDLAISKNGGKPGMVDGVLG